MAAQRDSVTEAFLLVIISFCKKKKNNFAKTNKLHLSLTLCSDLVIDIRKESDQHFKRIFHYFIFHIKQSSFICVKVTINVLCWNVIPLNTSHNMDFPTLSPYCVLYWWSVILTGIKMFEYYKHETVSGKNNIKYQLIVVMWHILSYRIDINLQKK